MIKGYAHPGAARSGKKAAQRGVRVSSAGVAQAPGFEVELQEKGGIAGLDRTFSLAGHTLLIRSDGQQHREVQLVPRTIQSLEQLIQNLQNIDPKRTYGRPGVTTDSMKIELHVRDAGGVLDVAVYSDPSDEAPEEFWQVVYDLKHAAMAGGSAIAAG